jgi:hypothetical protein
VIEEIDGRRMIVSGRPHAGGKKKRQPAPPKPTVMSNHARFRLETLLEDNPDFVPGGAPRGARRQMAMKNRARRTPGNKHRD